MNDMERFLARLDIADQCWEWTGRSGGHNKYGRVGNGAGSHTGAHRKSYELFVGPIPDGMWVLHACDNRKCVNPRHLFLGTHEENMADMKQKGRAVGHTGKDNGNSKLTEADVVAIRTSMESAKALAEKFGVTTNRIYQLRKGMGWKHVSESCFRRGDRL